MELELGDEFLFSLNRIQELLVLDLHLISLLIERLGCLGDYFGQLRLPLRASILCLFLPFQQLCQLNVQIFALLGKAHLLGSQTLELAVFGVELLLQHAHELEMLGQFLAVFLLIALRLKLKGLAHLLVLLD